MGSRAISLRIGTCTDPEFRPPVSRKIARQSGFSARINLPSKHRKKVFAMTRLTTALTAIALASLTAGTAKASEKETVTMLLNQALAGMDGKEVNMVLVDVPAGFETPRHLHPGHLCT